VPVLREYALELLGGIADGSNNGTAPDAPPPDFTIAQVADRFGRDPSTVRGWLAAGRFPGAYHFRGRERRIPLAAVLAFEDQQRTAPPPRKKPRSRHRKPKLGDWRNVAP
jgi:helix-turn-helix protein